MAAPKDTQHGSWGFNSPNQDLFKVVIDLRHKQDQPTHFSPERESFRPSLASILEEQGKAWNIKLQELKRSGAPIPEMFRDENQRPRDDRNFHPFGSDQKYSDRYFGGPIVEKSAVKWRATYYTRTCGDVIGANECNVPIPFNMSLINKSVAVMSSTHMTQSAVWVGPRLLLSTLHLYPWIQGVPSDEECELCRKSGQMFNVESGISAQLLSPYSPKVKLVEFSAKDDIGIFKLLDEYEPRTDYIDLGWITESDDIYSMNLSAGRKVACTGYSGKIRDEDVMLVKQEAALQLTKSLPHLAFTIQPLDLDTVAKPGFKSFCPGTLDLARAEATRPVFGVSASLWKGSSGGPCVLLDGPQAGAIIGLVRGYELLSDPYNMVYGFPAGLKMANQMLQEESAKVP